MVQVGGSFGAAAGLVLMENLPVEWNIQPGIYAIVGATAMLGGVFRSSISLVGALVTCWNRINLDQLHAKQFVLKYPPQ